MAERETGCSVQTSTPPSTVDPGQQRSIRYWVKTVVGEVWRKAERFCKQEPTSEQTLHLQTVKLTLVVRLSRQRVKSPRLLRRDARTEVENLFFCAENPTFIANNFPMLEVYSASDSLNVITSTRSIPIAKEIGT